MGKNEFQKRVGQLYAQGIQFGYTEEELINFIEQSMFSFLAPKKGEYYKDLHNKNLVKSAE
jgi:hypothetical protein